MTMKKTRNLFIRGSTLCLIVFVMVLVLMAPNNVLAAQTINIEIEKLQTDFTGTDTKHFLQAAAVQTNNEPAAYFARNYITGNIGNAGHNKIFATVNTDLVNMRTGLTRNVAIAANTEATGYHPKIC